MKNFNEFQEAVFKRIEKELDFRLEGDIQNIYTESNYFRGMSYILNIIGKEFFHNDCTDTDNCIGMIQLSIRVLDLISDKKQEAIREFELKNKK